MRFGDELGAAHVTRGQGRSFKLFEYPKSSQRALRTNA